MERISNTQAVYTIAQALLACEVRPVDEVAIDKATAAAIMVHRDFQSNFSTKLAKWAVGASDPLYRDVKNKLEEEWRISLSGPIQPVRAEGSAHPYVPQPNQPQQVQPQYRIEAIPRLALESSTDPKNQIPPASQPQSEPETRSANQFCRNCGIQLQESPKFCSSCGTRIAP